jgi:acyl-CoA dehydrogenase
MMDFKLPFELPEELNLLRETTAKVVQKELVPLEKKLKDGDPIPSEVIKIFRELGFFGITIPQEYGGMGLGILGYIVVQEELGKTLDCFNLLISGNNGIGSLGILYFGSEEQKRKYLPRMASGEIISAFALTEPGAGSDAQSIKTRAEKKGDFYILNGTKHFITRADIADVFTVIAVTDPQKKARGGFSAFIVEKGMKGFKITKTHETMGSDIVKQGELVFEDCEVPAENLIGNEGDGFKVAMSVLAEGRLGIGARAVGASIRLFEEAVKYSKERVQFGQPICEFQGIRWMLSEMATTILAARSMLYAVALRRHKGEDVTAEASMVKLFATENAWRIGDMALQIFGGYGYMKDYPVERILRDIRSMRIIEGTSEIQKLVIARAILK